MKKNILFLCTGNSRRSQMAEAWLRHLNSDKFAAFSAGIAKHGMNPRAVKVMQEMGIDMSAHHSKLLAEVTDVQFDLVVTVCGHANESCPIFPGKTKVVHVPFDDPPAMTRDMTDEEEILACYRRVRDEIANFIKTSQIFND